MADWRKDIEQALADFQKDYSTLKYDLEFQEAPHEHPTKLPAGKMAVYGFWWSNAGWLKIGKAGQKSERRYTHQHYNEGNISTLAGSIARDSRMSEFIRTSNKIGDWIEENCSRVNILISASHGEQGLKDLEAFLHERLKPRYEGRTNQSGSSGGK